ncbi:type III secretion system chaperone family protein [Allosalinactinospora lopnorensis]|uniref:hypothetical protein n=1 Tax=Allosalinactinospora lopnorensis TaxID=1352348 RepID=UPI000623D466|nr:hypothetical protein [Allosalinactinospora lopnorensis]
MDESAFPVVLFILGPAIAIAIMCMAAGAHSKKVKELTAWAGRHGWRYDERRPDLVDHFPGDPFDRGGSSRSADHVLSGSHRGHRVLLYEHRYTKRSHNGQSTTSTTHRHRIAAVATPAPTPVLEIKEQHFGHVLLNLIGMHDLRIGDPRFDDAFRVTADDDDFARSVLSEELRTWLLAQPPGRRVPLRFTGDHLVTWESIRLDPDYALEAADHLIDVLERIPVGVWEQHRH